MVEKETIKLDEVIFNFFRYEILRTLNDFFFECGK